MSLSIDIDYQSEKFQKVLDVLKDTTRKFIIVDGVIGAGKTTVMKLLEKNINNINNIVINNSDTYYTNKKQIKVKAIYEPVDLWNKTGALQYFYKDIPKNCYEFQTYTFITRISSVIDEIYNCQDADIYILERSIWTDRYIFMELLKDLVGDLRMTMYNQWCDLWAYIMPMKVNKWVLLDTSLDESLKRISSRNRNGEDGISLDYQTNLYNKHIEFFKKLEDDGKPIVHIQSSLMDSNFIEDIDKLNNIIQHILD
jgi:deoxyadenosine/deoxycytidine kinase